MKFSHKNVQKNELLLKLDFDHFRQWSSISLRVEIQPILHESRLDCNTTARGQYGNQNVCTVLLEYMEVKKAFLRHFQTTFSKIHFRITNFSLVSDFLYKIRSNYIICMMIQRK